MPLYAAYATHTHECHSGLLIGALRELSNNPKIASRRTFTIKQKFTTHQLAYLITYLLHSFDLLAGHHTTHTLHPATALLSMARTLLLTLPHTHLVLSRPLPLL